MALLLQLLLEAILSLGGLLLLFVQLLREIRLLGFGVLYLLPEVLPKPVLCRA
eukprot:CAMPEP_0204043020 /NCGR_PEP_ID=MMETSP0360-20130528/100229_1 /ASSEMBLY_ACC=CAM_ASM_000342 /TAXON_ID=268821 /ORGANISM="Scrippsiella Hangoei, Strain SHTV-5" /LENGTH=52 /DNA_ID=CAMNT_0050989347 /DNA_START=69 /DNA_END=223 /DNA_ORIENTATION=-